MLKATNHTTQILPLNITKLVGRSQSPVIQAQLPSETFVPSGLPALKPEKVVAPPTAVVLEKIPAPVVAATPSPTVLVQMDAPSQETSSLVSFAAQLAELSATAELNRKLAGLSDYKSPHPSYEQYNVGPRHYDSAQEILESIRAGQPASVKDVRANSYSLGTYLGVNAQKEGIVAQQVVDVLNTLRHFSGDPEALETQLRKGLNVQEGRAKELAQLAPSLAPFRNLSSFSQIAENETLTNAVATFVESSHNWGPQPEDFGGTGSIVKSLMGNKSFAASMDKEALNAKMEKKPPVGIILRNLGYQDGISNTLQEASMGVQAVDRLIFTPKNACDLVPIKNIATSPPPFPKQIADKIEPYAKDIQLAVKLNLAVANALQSDQIKFGPEQTAAFTDNRLRLAYLSAGELSGILAKEKTTSSPARQEKVQETIDQLQLKREAIEAQLGQDKLRDLDVTGKAPADIRQMMKPLMQESRDIFEGVVGQLSQGEQKDKILNWVKEFADLTSLKPAA